MSSHVVYVMGGQGKAVAAAVYVLGHTGVSVFDVALECEADNPFTWSHSLEFEIESKIIKKDIEDLRDAIIKMGSVSFPVEKVLCTKPYKSKIRNSKYAGNNFKRSGFQASGKLARGRI